jgi:hypothetical protein
VFRERKELPGRREWRGRPELRGFRA